ncbi:MAG: efflux RND transporter periplasmic adaptor subunit [Pseudopedobacter saltans]|uniref:Efflux RND transporter periplasmic adaptor subunit n=1 Tax=Pseudopedobacter saltans TaxID=151895 RepID=A0A2W5ERA0_9SPHI|nr:MAG: efflux RND transporter periplasmic adaptor subunit [Pseudopedobacter saltans]
MFSMVLFSCKDKPKQDTADDRKYVLPDSMLKTLHLDTVRLRPNVDAVTLTGVVDFNQDNMVHIYPLVSGNLQGIKVMLGDYVHAGDVLGTIKSTDVAGMSSSLVNAQANLSVTKRALDAAKSMFQSGLNAQTDVVSAEGDFKQAQAELARVKQVMQINGAGSGVNSIIKAPISGFVVEKNVTNNTYIRSDNGNPMFTISDLKNVWVMANVYESSITKVRKGDRAEVTTLSYPDRVFNGSVSEVMNVLDPQSKVMKVKIALPNTDYALKPQMFTTVNIIQNEGGQSLAVPASALIFNDSQYYVLVYKSPSDIRITPVTISGTTANYTYIKSGLQQGDVLIASQALMIFQELNG